MYSRFKYTNRDNFYKVLSKEYPEKVDISKDEVTPKVFCSNFWGHFKITF